VEFDAHLAAPASGTRSANGITLGESDAYDRALGVSSGSRRIAVLIRGYRTSQVTAQAGVGKLADVIDSRLVGAGTAPSSDQLFGRPVLGFHPALGRVLEGNVRTPQGPGPLVKVAILSAASGGITVAVAIVYPVQQGRAQQDNPDRPYDTFGDQILETVRFPSDGAT
jgi:hypothetical protein